VVEIPGDPLDRAPTAHEAGRLAALRRLLRELAGTVAAGAILSEEQLRAFNRIIGRAPVRAQLEVAEEGGYLVDFAPVSGDWIDRAERELAGSLSSMLRRVHPPRLKLCEAEGCGRLFYDESRSRTRRWCDSRTCGNRARVRRHRARSR